MIVTGFLLCKLGSYLFIESLIPLFKPSVNEPDVAVRRQPISATAIPIFLNRLFFCLEPKTINIIPIIITIIPKIIPPLKVIQNNYKYNKLNFTI